MYIVGKLYVQHQQLITGVEQCNKISYSRTCTQSPVTQGRKQSAKVSDMTQEIYIFTQSSSRERASNGYMVYGVLYQYITSYPTSVMYTMHYISAASRLCYTSQKATTYIQIDCRFPDTCPVDGKRTTDNAPTGFHKHYPRLLWELTAQYYIIQHSLSRSICP